MSVGKRAFDVFWASVGTVSLSPVLLAIAVLIRVDDGAPVLYRQLRIGSDGRAFRVLKFRTMTTDAESLGGSLTADGDPRVTRIGGWLRRWKLDELPQLLNVIRGEMSLVGPRPEVPRYVAFYNPQQRRVLALTPGITDPATLRFRREGALLSAAEDPEELYLGWIMPEKIRISLEYSDRATRWTDLVTIFRTLVPFGTSAPVKTPLDWPVSQTDAARTLAERTTLPTIG
jgi:lipopolysaccharide/colanic/teichoic acid biosynthesis glycosyltransferase